MGAMDTEDTETRSAATGPSIHTPAATTPPAHASATVASPVHAGVVPPGTDGLPEAGRGDLAGRRGGEGSATGDGGAMDKFLVPKSTAAMWDSPSAKAPLGGRKDQHGAEGLGEVVSRDHFD
eukprot:SAG11_NODE_933_length_6488_cov_18.190014_4_plen_122_part_00